MGVVKNFAHALCVHILSSLPTILIASPLSKCFLEACNFSGYTVVSQGATIFAILSYCDTRVVPNCHSLQAARCHWFVCSN